MAKTIMIANEIYEDLKKLKEKENKSYSFVIKEMLDSKKKKTIGDLLKFRGIPKDDNEYDEVLKGAKKYWAKWTKRYA